ncbi:putative aminoadipate-semialdehyde dehydrogenase [Hypoxylon rubiginosum]|uniref:Aminoadipate-semialdehyde dehydrogenase n=1 Tax=Hypoxylon rubiginosum TaxID=110542 RepID=A0ACC0D264_9PEZI|nr:putative aminoadipate-semialdehyde dehydrogenase [Hypoxylon rubiginosum]
MSLADVDESTIADLANACNIPTNYIEDVYSSTPIQLDMIAETRNEVINSVLTLGPEVDVDKFCEAIRKVVSLYPIFRTRLAPCGLGILQVITNEEHITERRFDDLEKYLYGDSMHRMGLGTPLFRTTVFDRVFVASIHHAVMDYISMAIVLGEDLRAAYLGLPLKMRPQFKEFVAYCMGIDEPEARSFWASRFKGAPAIFPRAKPSCKPSFKDGTVRNMTLDRIGNGVSPNHVPYFIEAAWALTASAYSGSDSLAYGYVISGRSHPMNGLETTLGPTTVEAPVQVNLQRTMTVEWLLKDRATALRQLQAHPASQYGTPKISSVSEAAKTASGFQTLLNIVPVLPIVKDNEYGRQRDLVWLGGSWPLVQICRIQDNKISLEPRHDASGICERQLDRIVNQFQHLIRLLMDVPPHTVLSKLSLLNAEDSLELAQWNKLTAQPAEECLHELFQAQARVKPDAIAVEASDGKATYQKLDEMSDYLASSLQKRGICPGDLVALIFEKSLWFIVAILGVMKVGAVCMPIDKKEKHDHKTKILSETNAKIILTSSAECACLLGLAPNVLAVDAELFAGSPEIHGMLDIETSSPEDLAYVTFTGGIEGAPKGVLLEHRSLVSSLRSHSERFQWGPGSRILQFAAHTSGTSICEIFGALLFGGCLCVPTEEACISSLPGFIESAGVNSAILPPGVLRDLSPNQVPSLRTLVSIGEPVYPGASQDWGAALRFFNCWGACEASMLNAVSELTPSSLYPESIGKPIGCAIWIVNPRNIHELIPIGAVGELLIQGPGLARGYLKNEARKADSFISPPQWAASFEIKGARFYRTGDLGKYNPDGSISFVGRQINQVRIGGQTVQLEEIESVLASCSQVKDIVTSSKVCAGRTQLVAMVRLADSSVLPQKLPKTSTEIEEQRFEAIRAYARSRLPSNMVPSLWLEVESVPRTASRKLDRSSARKWLKTVRQ